MNVNIHLNACGFIYDEGSLGIVQEVINKLAHFLFNIELNYDVHEVLLLSCTFTCAVSAGNLHYDNQKQYPLK